jgi:hypothetical protein
MGDRRAREAAKGKRPKHQHAAVERSTGDSLAVDVAPNAAQPGVLFR